MLVHGIASLLWICSDTGNLRTGEWRIEVWNRDGTNQNLAETTSKLMVILFGAGFYCQVLGTCHISYHDLRMKLIHNITNFPPWILFAGVILFAVSCIPLREFWRTICYFGLKSEFQHCALQENNGLLLIPIRMWFLGSGMYRHNELDSRVATKNTAASSARQRQSISHQTSTSKLQQLKRNQQAVVTLQQLNIPIVLTWLQYQTECRQTVRYLF